MFNCAKDTHPWLYKEGHRLVEINEAKAVIYFERLLKIPSHEEFNVLHSRSCSPENFGDCDYQTFATDCLIDIYWKNGEYKKASPLITNRAYDGHKDSEIKLGDMHKIGMGEIRQNYQQAAYWYRKAAMNNEN